MADQIDLNIRVTGSPSNGNGGGYTGGDPNPGSRYLADPAATRDLQRQTQGPGKTSLSEIRTPEQLQALEKLRTEYERYIRALSEAGRETKYAEAKLGEITTALNGENAALVRQIALLEKTAGAYRQMGTAKAAGMAQGIEQAIAGLRQRIPQGEDGGPGFFAKMSEHVDMLGRAYVNAGGGLRGFLQTMRAGGAVVALWAAAIAAALKVAKEAVPAYAEFEQAASKLDATLAGQGFQTDQYREHLHQLAQEMRKTTGVAKQEWLQALTVLTQAGATPANVDKYAQAVKNLAGLMGGDVKQASQEMASAVRGSFGQFERFGIYVGETMTQAEKMDRVLQGLATRGGQQFDTQLKTINGRYQEFKTSSLEALQALGSWISSSGIVQKSLDGMSGAMRGVVEIIGIFSPKIKNLINQQHEETNAMDRAIEARKRYHAATQAAANANDDFAKSIDRARDAQNRTREIMAERVNAQMDLRRAQIDLLEERKAISPVQAAGRRAQMEEYQIRFKAMQDQIKLQQHTREASENYVRVAQDELKHKKLLAEVQEKLKTAKGEDVKVLKDQEEQLKRELPNKAHATEEAGKNLIEARNDQRQRERELRDKELIDLRTHGTKTQKVLEEAQHTENQQFEENARKGIRLPWQPAWRLNRLLAPMPKQIPVITPQALNDTLPDVTTDTAAPDPGKVPQVFAYPPFRYKPKAAPTPLRPTEPPPAPLWQNAPEAFRNLGAAALVDATAGRGFSGAAADVAARPAPVADPYLAIRDQNKTLLNMVGSIIKLTEEQQRDAQVMSQKVKELEQRQAHGNR